ncbi:MAG: hypothetical protein AAF728_02720, partial [Cyanobacteria bacterium P01_D01_bin.128]
MLRFRVEFLSSTYEGGDRTHCWFKMAATLNYLSSSQPVIIGAKAMPIIDIPSIHKHFPRNAKPPEQLIQLLEWLQSSRYG